MVSVCKRNIIFPCVYLCICPIVLLSPKPLGGIQPNLLHHFPSWYGVHEQNCFSMCLCIYCPSISIKLSFNPVGRIQPNFLRGKGVWEQFYFSMCPVFCASAHLSVMLSPPKPLGRIQSTVLLLAILAVWSGPTLSADRMIGYYRIYE